MLSLHQLRCFLTAYELGSLTAAATELGFAQPSVSQQIRHLERSVQAVLFDRVGRGVVPTEAGKALRPHAERALRSAAEGQRAVRAVSELTSGTVRLGIFGTARLYLGAQLVADVLQRHPGVRVELIGQNSAAVQEDLRRGRLEAALIALPVVGEGLTIEPVARDELVYVSIDRERLRRPVTPRQLALAPLVLPETTWRDEDSSRRILRELVQRGGATLNTRIEVEDVETAVEIVGLGLADSVLPRGVIDQLIPRLAPNANWVPLRPRSYDTIAMVHRRDAALSPAARVVTELAIRRIQSITEPL
jgi:DNA-binding transcriptional LysR family regulator